MKVFDYVAHIYRTALFLHPALFVLVRWANTGALDFPTLVMGGLFGVMFSLPGFVLCYLAFRYAVIFIRNKTVAFGLWILSVLGSIITGFGLLASLFFGFDVFVDLIAICYPGCGAAVLSILIHYNRFFALARHSSAKTLEYENPSF